MIIVDQWSVSDAVLVGGRASYSSRRRRRADHRSTAVRSALRQTSQVDDDDPRHLLTRHSARHRLPYQLVHQLQTAAVEDVDRLLFAGRVADDDRRDESGEIVTRRRSEVRKRDEPDQGGTTEVRRSRSDDGRGQLDNYVSLDTRGDFELFWDVDSVTETIQFRLVANVDEDAVLAFGFSAYGEPRDADFCVVWTNRHGRHLFQVIPSLMVCLIWQKLVARVGLHYIQIKPRVQPTTIIVQC